MARTNVGKPQYQKPKSAARKSVEVQAGGRTRQILLDVDLARRVAKGQTTKMMKGFYMPGKGSAEYARQADALKSGVIGMAARANMDSELVAKLNKMEPDKLKYMYDHNEFVFDVYFQYEGINYTGSTYQVIGDAKDRDARFLIEEYERAFGKLLIWPT